MRQDRDFWTDRRIKIAAQKWAEGEEAKAIACDFGIRLSLLKSVMASRTDLFPKRKDMRK